VPCEKSIPAKQTRRNRKPAVRMYNLPQLSLR
jgi:hypothetical protein